MRQWVIAMTLAVLGGHVEAGTSKAIPSGLLQDASIHWNANASAPRLAILQPTPLPAIGVADATNRNKIVGKNLLQWLAPVYHLDALAEQATYLHARHILKNGGELFEYRQAFNEVPVVNGRVTVLADKQQNLRALSGELAPAAPISTHSLSVAQANKNLAIAIASLKLPASPMHVTKADQREWQFAAATATAKQSGLSTAAASARAQAIYFPTDTGLVPAWRYEIKSVTGQHSKLARVTVSESGVVLETVSLSREASYSYRVYADTSGEFQPFDSPYGDLTPHPTGNPTPELNPSYVSANNVLLQDVSSVRNDPWLPDSAVELTGNNADVYLDVAADDSFTPGTLDRRVTRSAVNKFEFSFDGAQDVRTNASNQNAAMVQAFYVVNWLHDVFYDVGFDEASGNGQESNFGRGGAGGDRMNLEMQDYDGTNNANMNVPGDGQNPWMQIFLFDGPSTQSVNVTGTLSASYVSGRASFGPSDFNQTAALVLTDDNAGLNVNDGCEAFINSDTLAGKIAVIDRGNCNFIDKVNRAQQTGAVGVLIVNNTSGVLTMGVPDGTVPTITIPSLLISKNDGDAVKAAMLTGTVNANLSRTTATPIDGALDSALVAHEWGHFLNNRLISIGSGNQANGMDEGWADFVALLTLSRSSDSTTGVYPFSAYTVHEFYNGLRRFPYSTDLTKNRLSFRHISNDVVLPDGRSGATNNEVHNTGEIWATALWECYMALVDNQGFAIAQAKMRQYLVTSQKLTPANPSFIEARDAVLAAAAGDAADTALFRAAFAKRGLGINAIAPVKTDDTQVGAIESFSWTSTAIPTVTAGLDQTVIQGDTVGLSGSATDADGSIASYQWLQLSGPSTSLTTPNAAATSFVAPAVTSTTTLVFRLEATDNNGERSGDEISVTVSPQPNTAPSSNAGADQSVTSGSMVTLSGSGSDTDGSISGYRWLQLSGPTVTLANPVAANTSFTAPTVTAETPLQFRLTVTDNLGATMTDTVNVVVRSSGLSTGGGGGGGGGVPLWASLLLITLCAYRRQRRQ